MTKETTQPKRRQLKGVVVSNKMDKTVVVQVDRVSVHPKYGKRYAESSTFKAHDEKNACQVGDLVTIEETRPLSKTKNWRVVPNAK